MLLLGIEVPLWALLSGGVIALLSLYIYLEQVSDPYKNSGLKGPTRYPFIGTVLSYVGVSLFELDKEFRKKYGKIVLTYDALGANILIYDPDFIRNSLIKHFDKLTDKRTFSSGSSLDNGLLNTGGEHWKHVRGTLSQAFTSGKLKRMLPMIQSSGRTLKAVLVKNKDRPVKIRDIVSAYTLEVIGATAFGLDVRCQGNGDDPFFKHATSLIGQFEGDKTLTEKLNNFLLVVVFFIAPKIIAGWCWLTGKTIFAQAGIDYFDSICEQMIAENQGEERNDFIKLVSNLITDTSPNNPDTLYDSKGLAWSKKGLSKKDVMGNAMLFIFAGYQTTADTLHYIFYELALNQEAQNKARAEILEICKTEEITYEQISKLEYSEWCINETLRLHPTVFRWDRYVSGDFECNGLLIKKGTYLTMCTAAIHSDPEYWEQPNDYNPDRWSPEKSEGRHPCAFLPFGYGPRQCIGVRLALMEMKVALVNILENFDIQPTATTTRERPLPKLSGFTILPKEPIELQFTPRN